MSEEMAQDQEKAAPKQNGAIIAVVCIVILGVVLYPTISGMLGGGAKATSTQRIKALTAGVLLYAAANDNKLPAGSTWMDAVAEYVKDPEAFEPPVREGVETGYSFNAAFKSKKIDSFEDPSKAPIIFEGMYSGRNMLGRYVTAAFSWDGECIMGMADGSVKSFNEVDAEPLDWPQAGAMTMGAGGGGGGPE
jgi:hypothetical protein